jgi:eukaryotic-like serine/threonine-protein kinase
VSSRDHPGSLSVPGDFAETVQFELPAPEVDPIVADSSAAGASDIGLEIATDTEAHVAEKPTLSHIGRYALKTLLGEGGLGCVYEAWDPLLSRTVAVKTLQFDLDMPSRIALDRVLLNEARAAANLNHAHIVTVHDAGLSAHGVYIAMERLRGRDMRQMLADGWRPSPEAAAQIVRRVADALAYAHARAVVHCDVKPGNIFLTPKGKPKVLDFGIARAAHANATPSGDVTIAGSPHYLAPEQLGGGVIDARTDIYSLGVVLYEMLAGRKAFRGETLEQIHASVRAGQATPLQELRPELPATLCNIVARAMDPDPQRRFASASELSQALRQWAGGAQPAAANDTIEVPDSPTRRRRIGWAAAAATLSFGAVAWLAQTEPHAPRPPVIGAVSAPLPAPVTPVVALAPTPAPPAPAPAATVEPTAAAPAEVRAAPASKPAPRVDKAKARAAAAASETAAALAQGTLQIAVTPWGEVEVDGRAAGTTPPLTQLTLSEGAHTVTIRNTDFPAFTTTVQVQSDKPTVVRHRFGS